MLMSSLQLADLDARQTLLNSVILAGGTSLLPGFADRLFLEFNNALGTVRLLGGDCSMFVSKCFSFL